MTADTYTLQQAKSKAHELALEVADDFHLYVFPAETRNRFIVVPEDEFDSSIHGQAKYCQNGRGARLGQLP